MTLADIDYEITDDVLLVRVSGEIDMSNSRAIARAVAGATPNGVAGVVLDLTDVEYLDSAGIHMIFRLVDGLSTRGQQLAVAIGPSSPVHDALALAGVKGLVPIEESVEGAFAALGNAEKHTTST